MQKYETAILFDPELPEERRKEFLAKVEGVISRFQGEVLKQDDWGIRKLAYPIRKKSNAYYTFLVYSGERGVVEEVERNIKIFEGVLRHLTSRVEIETKVAPPAEAGEPSADAEPEPGEGSAGPVEEAPIA
jgi:small subunit ribosomal protein S6